MSTVFVDDGTTVRVIEAGDNFRNRLAGGIYEVNYNDMQGFFLRHAKPFSIPAKLYGNLTVLTTRILTTFKARDKSTGVLLSGEKGSGKTLLAKHIATSLVAEGVPTLLVNQAFYGPKFNSFLQSIEQDCVVLFDEFEKVYTDENEKTGLLTLLDGVITTRKMYLMTCNNIYQVDSHMQNRPGRIFYALHFRGVTDEFIEEYCNDKLLDKNWTAEIMACTKRFSVFNFDMLQAMVEEVNRYNEPPKSLLCMLNLCPTTEEGDIWASMVVIDGKNSTIMPQKRKYNCGIIEEMENDGYVHLCYSFRDKLGRNHGDNSGFRECDLVSASDEQIVFRFAKVDTEGPFLDPNLVGDYNEAFLVLTKAKKKYNFPSYDMYGG